MLLNFLCDCWVVLLHGAFNLPPSFSGVILFNKLHQAGVKVEVEAVWVYQMPSCWQKKTPVFFSGTSEQVAVEV